MQILFFFHIYSRLQFSLTWPAFTLNKTIYQTSRKGKKQDKTIAEFAFQENLEKNLIEIYSAYKTQILKFNDTSGRTCALLNSVQKFIEIQGWLLLTFFICLHNQLSSFNSIVVQMSEKRDSPNRQ